MWGKQSSAPRGNERFTQRRRSRYRRVAALLFVLALLLVFGAVYGLRQDTVRISQIQVFSTDTSPAGEEEPLADIARAAMQGMYFGLVPRDSILLFPASRIRADILAARPGIAAVSLSRNGLTSISIRVDERVPIARWCGLAPTEGAEEYCYLFDAGGFVFATAATTTETINSFSLYAPLEGDGLEPLPAGRQGLRATLSQTERLPGAFDFARELVTLGSPVTHIVIRGDEVDAMLASGTRVTYVLGDEQNAFTALVSARDNINLSDGSIEYIDLRFDGKVYLKKKGESQ